MKTIADSAALSLDPETPPLRMDAEDVIRIGSSRVSFDLIVEQYESGMTPEYMVRAYDTLVLADVYGAIAYYLRHRDAVQAYLNRRQSEAASIQQKIETERPRVTRRQNCLHASGVRRLAMLSLASDADINGEIIRGLRRRMPELDLIRAQDVLPEGTSDSDVLALSAAQGRVLITNDRNTMIGLAYGRAVVGEPVPGLIATTNAHSIGSAIDDILLIAEFMSEEEIREQVVIFLPFRG